MFRAANAVFMGHQGLKNNVAHKPVCVVLLNVWGDQCKKDPEETPLGSGRRDDIPDYRGMYMGSRMAISWSVGSQFYRQKGCTHRAIILFNGAIDRHRN